jgi:hypothetical protein
VSATSDDSNLNDGVIVVSIGTRYASYCANVSRTFLIDPTKKQVCAVVWRDPLGRVLGRYESHIQGTVS